MSDDLMIAAGLILLGVYTCALFGIWGCAATHYNGHWMSKFYGLMVFFPKGFSPQGEIYRKLLILFYFIPMAGFIIYGIYSG